MLRAIKRWYNGLTVIHEFEKDSQSSVVIFPMVYTEYHWSAKIARAVVGFYSQNWQWLWVIGIAIASLYVAVIALK